MCVTESTHTRLVPSHPDRQCGPMSELWRSGSEGWNQNAKVRVSRLAERQWGRVSWPQLERLGVSKAGVARWVRAGYLHRVAPSVYAVGHRARSTEGDLAAALLYAGPGAALSHATALWWQGLIDRPPSVIDVSSPHRRRSLVHVRVHDRRPGDRIWIRGFPLTPLALALRDYAV